jgi:hypothetical protein
MDLDVKKHADRHWQIGPYVIRLPSDHEDCEESAWKHGFRLLHEGRHEWAKTFRMAPYHWRIDGRHVVLPSAIRATDDGHAVPAPDTEEAARALLAEADGLIETAGGVTAE